MKVDSQKKFGGYAALFCYDIFHSVLAVSPKNQNGNLEQVIEIHLDPASNGKAKVNKAEHSTRGFHFAVLFPLDADEISKLISRIQNEKDFVIYHSLNLKGGINCMMHGINLLEQEGINVKTKLGLNKKNAFLITPRDISQYVQGRTQKREPLISLHIEDQPFPIECFLDEKRDEMPLLLLKNRFFNRYQGSDANLFIFFQLAQQQGIVFEGDFITHRGAIIKESLDLNQSFGIKKPVLGANLARNLQSMRIKTATELKRLSRK